MAEAYSKDVVQFLQRSLLRFGHKEEDHDECDNVKTGIKTESTNGVETVDKERERDAEKGGETQTGGDGETHAELTVR